MCMRMPSARDSLYVVIGFGVLAVQRLQLARRALQRGVDERITHRREGAAAADGDR